MSTKKATQQLQCKDLLVGTGVTAQDGHFVRVHYTGKLTDGEVFDSSLDAYDPFEFQLGSGEVIEGWDLGILGMKEGGKRELTIPPHLAYGDRDMDIIPPNSTLIFEVELVKVLQF